MSGPKQMLWNIFCALVCPGTLEHHRQQGKSSCFLPICLFWNLVRGLMRICRIQWRCSIFLLFIGITLFGQIGPTNQNCQFVLNFGTWANSNMQNSLAMFNFSAFYWNYPFWVNLVQPIKIVSLS